MADDASAAWYCADAEQQIFGPLSVAQLAGSLLPDGAVFTREGMSGWVPLTELPQLVAAINALRAPPAAARTCTKPGTIS